GHVGAGYVILRGLRTREDRAMADATELEQATGRTMADLATAAGQRFGDRTAVRFKRDGDWHETSYADVATLVNELAGGLAELRERGRSSDHGDELSRRRDGVSENDPYTIIYTSGTTGNPKGVALTHANAGSVSAVTHELDFVTEDDSQYLYLPLAHVFALICVLGAWDIGAPIIFFSGNTKKIVPELAETQPTYFPSVPRIFEKIYTLVTSNIDSDTVKKAVEVGMKVRKGEAEPDETFNQFEEKLYKNVRAAFGGNIRQAVTGSAPIAPDILEFFSACGVTVLEGWGLTETTGIGCVNTSDAFKVGTVGKPAP